MLTVPPAALVASLSASLVLGAALSARGQAPRQPDAARILHEIEGLGVVGTVLYVAAHPDDENTRLLAWLAGGRHVRAVYLSLTRGDGGQNLIGAEQDAAFGALRTDELLAARRLDGAEQLFTRARDFGYSKSAGETLALWGHDEILADVVRAIRRVRPDVVVTRFATDGPPTHGHHTASALLAAEAFRAAGDPRRFPEQLAEGLAPFQPARLVYNVSHWLLTPETDTARWLAVDVGAYDPLLGVSYGELAGRSRSMHRSQGFGAAQERGPLVEYFEHLAGREARGDLLDGLDLSWGRFPDGAAAGTLAAAARDGFDPRAPWRSIPALLALRDAVAGLGDAPWRAYTLARVDALVGDCAGLYLAATTAAPAAAPGEAVSLRLEATNRSPAALRLVAVTLPDGRRLEAGAALADNRPLVREERLALPPDTPVTTPYWLREPPLPGRFQVARPVLVGLPVGPPALPVTFEVEVAGRALSFVRDVSHRRVDLVDGEVVEPFVVRPPAAVAFERDVLLFPDGGERTLRARVQAGRPALRGTLTLVAPPGWQVTPASAAVRLAAPGDEAVLSFGVTPGDGAAPGALTARFQPEGARAAAPALSALRIAHPHVPPRTIHAPATVRLVSFDLRRASDRVGYVAGPGDRVAESLRDAGYQVDALSDETLTNGDLDAFDSIVVGVRAFSNTPRMAVWQPRLLDWVARGGTLVVQYATVGFRSELVAPLGPAPLTVGRGRVTDETAPVTFLASDHPVLQRPNPITAADFEGWVQERGLYFGERWDPAWQPILRMADPDEAPQDGSLLVLPHGEGRIVYTGLSFFRQLPAGVPGAVRLFANLIDHAN
jgi:LmbE family N-acetylglucosaminyl deacetylase